MIPFNKIPKGLRASLFFGELFLDGDSLGSESEPSADCSPSELVWDKEPYFDSVQIIEYSINRSAFQTISYEYSEYTGVTSILSQIEMNEEALFVFGGGGLAYFQHFGRHISGGKSEPNDPIELTLMDVGNSTFVKQIAGTSTVTLYSCGKSDFPGI